MGAAGGGRGAGGPSAAGANSPALPRRWASQALPKCTSPNHTPAYVMQGTVKARLGSSITVNDGTGSSINVLLTTQAPGVDASAQPGDYLLVVGKLVAKNAHKSLWHIKAQKASGWPDDQPGWWDEVPAASTHRPGDSLAGSDNDMIGAPPPTPSARLQVINLTSTDAEGAPQRMLHWNAEVMELHRSVYPALVAAPH